MREDKNVLPILLHIFALKGRLELSLFYWYYNNDVSFYYIWKINNKSLKQITKYVVLKDLVGILTVCIITIDNQLYSLLKEKIQWFLSSNISSPLIFQSNLS
jgi:hypothetical protein